MQLPDLLACTDYYDPAVAPVVLDAVTETPEWECEIVIAAEAYCAEFELNPN